MAAELQLNPEVYGIFNSRFFNHFDDPYRIKIFYGGAGSGKSISIAQYFLQKLISGDGKRRAILRKTFPSMKVSTYLVLKDILKDWGVPYHENKTDHYFEVGDNRLYYLSLDDPEKIKGAEFVDIWLEEATEFAEDDFKQLRIRLSRDKRTENAVIWLSFNPIDEHHWVIPYTQSDDPRIDVHHSTYKDNRKNLSSAFVEELEKLQETDNNFYRIYTLGLPGVLENKIYNTYFVEDPATWPSGLENAQHCYGLDFGFNHPMALIEVWYYEEEFYIKERYYESGKTTDDLYIWMNENGISHTDYIFADSAEPDRIDTLCKSRKMDGVSYQRFNVHPAKKDVKAGLDFLKSKKKHIASSSVNLIKELRNYKYKETKDGQVLDEPVKFMDDACDAMRYGAYTMNIRSGPAPKTPLPEESGDRAKAIAAKRRRAEEDLFGGGSMPQW